MRSRKSLIFQALLGLGLGACALMSGPSNQDQDRANDYFSAGVGYFGDQKYPQSLQAFEEASRLWPQNPNFEMHRALALFYVGREDQALSLMEKTCPSVPQFPECHNNLSALYLKQKRYAPALASAEKALSVPTYVSPELAFTNKGLALQGLGRPREALQALQSVKEERNSRIARCQNLILQSRSHLALAEFSDARRKARVARELCENEARCRFWQAYVEYRLGEMHEAREILDDTMRTFRDAAIRDEARTALNRLNREEALAEPEVIL
jgi:Tfp pilus assembly protein PilF